MDGRLVRGRRSREEILDAASRLMSQRGYDGTTISTISKESGLPTGSIYHHFDSKAAILAAVMERGAQRFFEQAAVLPPTSTAPVDRLLHALEASRDSLRQNEEFLRLFILLLLSNDNAQAAAVVDRVRAQGRGQLYELIRVGFLPCGEEAATIVADRLVDIALAMFDGIFIASQVAPELAAADRFDQMARSLAMLGADALATARH